MRPNRTTTGKKCAKKRDVRSALLFCQFKPVAVFCRSRCRCCCLSSLITPAGIEPGGHLNTESKALAINSATAHSIRSRCSEFSKYEYLYSVLPCWSRAWLICSLSHCLNPGIGDSVEYCVMFGNSCCNCSTTCFIRKLPRSTPLSPARKTTTTTLLRRRGSRINTDLFPKRAPKAQACSGVRGGLPQEMFWIFIP